MVTIITLICPQCSTSFEVERKRYRYARRCNPKYKAYCGKKCRLINANNVITLQCDNCAISFQKKQSEIAKTKHNFCSTNCAGIFNNKERHNLEKTKKVNCKYCNEIFLVSQTSPKKVCDVCRKLRNKIQSIRKPGRKYLKPKIQNCILCNASLELLGRYCKYCSTCKTEKMKMAGQINGKKSAASQQRRSKNEIHFADLCIKEYPDANVTTNEQFFESKHGKWDADVIIHKYKIAILWNGVWHYKQIKKDCSLLQIQTRDKIKLDIINKSGYTPYIIKDEGKCSPKFVEAEFEKLKKIISIDRVA